MKIQNDNFDQIVKESDRQFNQNLISVCELCMEKGKENPFSCKSISEILEVAIEKCNTNSGMLDVKKVQV